MDVPYMFCVHFIPMAEEVDDGSVVPAQLHATADISSH